MVARQVSTGGSVVRSRVGVILFDGSCELCARSVRFLIRRDPRGRLRYAALGTAVARQLLAAHGLPADKDDTVVLIEDGRVSERSTAVLRALRLLRGPWPLLAVALVVPRSLRDAVYDYVSRHRRDWFDACRTCPWLRRKAPDRFLDLAGP